RARVDLPDGGAVVVVVMHLHHSTEDEAARDEQTRQLVGWLAGAPAADGLIVVGDFNAEPTEPTYGRMRAAGFRSSYLEANGAEPAVTWPSGLDAPAKDTDGPSGCLDYIWVRGSIAVESCRLAFDRPAVCHPTLYPSGQLALSAPLPLGLAA